MGAELIEAVKAGDKEKVKSLLSKDTDVNDRDKFGWTALMGASYKGHSGVVELLKRHGACG